MLARVFNGVAVVAVASLLSGGGFVGYLVATGHLTAQRFTRIAAVMRGELDALPSDSAAATSQPTTAPAEDPRATSAKEIRLQRERQHLETIQLERTRRDLEAQKRLVDQALQQLLTGQEQLVQKKAELVDQHKRREVATQETGFQRELDYFSTLSPKLAKEHLVRIWKKQRIDAVRLFAALDMSRGKRILEQMKSGEELELLHELLEQLRIQGVESYAKESGKTSGNAPPD